MKNLFVFILCVISVSARPVLGAQEWNPPSAGPVTTWTAPVCGKGEFVVQPYFFYYLTRGTFDTEGRYNSLPDGDKKYQYIEQLFFQYGLTERLEFDGQIAYQQNIAEQGGTSARSAGFSDSYIFLRACLLDETESMPQVTGLLQLRLPTGKYQKAGSGKPGTDITGTGAYEYGVGLNLSKKVKPFIFHVDAGYNFSVKAKVDGVRTEYNNYLNFDLGAEYFFGRGFNLILEWNGFLQGDRKEAGARLPATDIKSFVISPGIGWSNDTVQTLLAYQRVVAGTNIDANDSVVFTFVYAF